jgi:hypothetical protein
MSGGPIAFGKAGSHLINDRSGAEAQIIKHAEDSMKPNHMTHLGTVQCGRTRKQFVGLMKRCLIYSGSAGLVLLSGCEAPGRYVVSEPPTESTRAFKNVEVAIVEVGTLEAQVDQSTLEELRSKIVEEIRKKKIYENVGLEALGASVLEIQPKIIAFHKGSATERYFLGTLAAESAKARMDVECKFINKETGQTIAQGVFTGEIAGGTFGGSADPHTLCRYVAQHVADFLSKGAVNLNMAPRGGSS